MNQDTLDSSEPFAGDLTLLRRVGKGSHGEVWLARTATGIFRAVKIVRRSTFSEDRPFEREFAGLQHFEPISREHIGLMDILHMGRDDSLACFYCVSELADSFNAPSGQPINPDAYEPRTLHTVLRLEGRLPVKDVIQLGMALADAVAFLHSRNLVHRDLKPSNIIYCQGIPKLADVGLVTTRDSTRSFVGTTGYVPLEGPGTEVADIYALGKILYQSATGMDAERYPELPASAPSWPDWSKFLELNSVIERACAPTASQRYKSAAGLKTDLQILSEGHSLRRFKQRRHHRNLALAMLLLVAFGGLLLRLFFPPTGSQESFRQGLYEQRWKPFLTSAYSRVEPTPRGIRLESRGGIDSLFRLPNDFELSGRFRFLSLQDHFRICLRTDFRPFDRDQGRDGVMVVINQTGEIMLVRPGTHRAVTEFRNPNPFPLGRVLKFRIVCRSDQFEVYTGDMTTPMLHGHSTYAPGAFLTLYNRELPGMRLELQSLAIRKLSEEKEPSSN